jgi:RNA polymerase sigma-70 factor (ECF subfamily)
MNTDTGGATPSEADSASAPARAPDHQQAMTDLVREHNRALHAFLMTRLHDEHEARDVAQEAYVRMLQLNEPGAVGFLRAYLFKTAANIAIDRARQRNNHKRLRQAAFTEEPVDHLSPDRHLLSAEAVRVFRQALLELAPKCRRAFMLYRFEEWSDVRIAQELGIQPRMVRYYLQQAGLYCRLRIKGLSAEDAKAATQ